MNLACLWRMGDGVRWNGEGAVVLVWVSVHSWSSVHILVTFSPQMDADVQRQHPWDAVCVRRRWCVRPEKDTSTKVVSAEPRFGCSASRLRTRASTLSWLCRKTSFSVFIFAMSCCICRTRLFSSVSASEEAGVAAARIANMSAGGRVTAQHCIGPGLIYHGQFYLISSQATGPGPGPGEE